MIKYKKTSKAYSTLEIITVLSIIATLILVNDYNLAIRNMYYKKRADLVSTEIESMIKYARNAAVILNTTIYICPLSLDNTRHEITQANINDYKVTNAICSNKWHDVIKIFYINNKTNKLSIVKVYNNLIKKTENLKYKAFTRSNLISVNQKGINNSLNGHIEYYNMYYNKNIIINRIGRAR